MRPYIAVKFRTGRFLSALLLMLVVVTISQRAVADVVATVNGTVITSSDVRIGVRNLERIRYYHASPSEDRLRELLFDALSELILTILQAEEAQRAGLTIDEKQVEAQALQIKAGRSDAEFEAVLQEQELNMAGLKDRIRRSLMAQVYLEKLLKDSGEASERECKEYYTQNRSMFETGDLYQLSIITIRIPPDRSKEAMEKAHRIMAEVRKELKNTMSFSEAAKRYSQDDFASAGGKMEPTPLGRFPEHIRDNIRTLSPGFVSDVVDSIYGLHLIRMEAVLPSRLIAFHEIKDEIRRILATGKKERLQRDDTIRLIESADIVISDPELNRQFFEKYP